ncbi:hypothetical protein MLD38_021531 [Melastoma candidum]|uniref:Uncharacterized protein n=1 Tax=Melastoma candidum TaxID=119954 RepID=A0ACB9QK87_9MYRT|nr:hypothetical protein MLD38_021531 [Melastoma candidum]
MRDCVRFHPLLPPAIVARPKQRSNSNPTFSLRCSRPLSASEPPRDGGGGELRFEEQVTRTREKELNRLELDLESEREGEGGGDIELSSKTVRVGGTDRWKGKSGRREILRRSHFLAKQVISMESALSLGFVSQLWVDPSSLSVVVVEVRPSLLSADSERFLLEDVRKVGDVLLVENEGVLESELKMAGLETLVGYEVVTPGRRSIGKVRGYSFNVNTGEVELLEIDSFGISIVPSSLVSTYALYTMDVLEVAPDTVFVQEEAVGRLPRLTQGWWGSRNAAASRDEDHEKPVRSARSRRGRRRGWTHPGGRRTTDDDWDLPMDFL